MTVPVKEMPSSVVAAGLWRAYARQHGAVLIDRADYIGLTGDRRVNDGALWLAPGAEPAAAGAAPRALPGGADLDIRDPRQIPPPSLSVFGPTFSVPYALGTGAALVRP